MKITKERLKQIVQEEMKFLEAEEVEAQGGDDSAKPAEKDVTRVMDKVERHLTPLLDKISSEKEFQQLMTSFLQAASKHPAVRTNMVRRVLVKLARQVTGEAPE